MLILFVTRQFLNSKNCIFTYKYHAVAESQEFIYFHSNKIEQKKSPAPCFSNTIKEKHTLFNISREQSSSARVLRMYPNPCRT